MAILERILMGLVRTYLNKFFEKIFKKVLTNRKNCDILKM